MKRIQNNHPIIVLLTLSMIMLSLAACHSPASVSSKKNTNQTQSEEKVDIEAEALSEIKGPYDGTQDSPWLQALHKTAASMADNHFQYNTSGIRSSLDKAIDGNRHGDCAHLISWSLQEYGILKKGQTFYSKKNGSLSCKEESKCYKKLKKGCEIIDAGGISCAKTEKLKDILHVGDICCYNLHMNVVAGVDDQGNILYYDAGLVPTEKKKGKKWYTQKLAEPFTRKSTRFKMYKLYTIIRVGK